MRITLRNDFHNTECNVIANVIDGEVVLSSRQIARAQAALCGSATCACGNAAGCRGPQFHEGKRVNVNTDAAFTD